jgi:hypothetical protein
MSKQLRMTLGLALVLGLVASSGFAASSLAVNAGAALNGTNFGLQVVMDHTATNAFVQSDHPTDESHYLFRFWIRPAAGLVIDPNTSVRIAAIGDDAGAVGQHIILFLRNDSTVPSPQYQLNFWYKDQAAAASYKFGGATFFKVIADPVCSRQYEAEWTRDTLAGSPAGNGTLVLRRLSVATAGTCTPTGLLTRTVNGMDNDTYQVDNARFGTLNGQASNANGSWHFDEMESYR